MSSQVSPTFRHRWYLFGIISIPYKRHGQLTKVKSIYGNTGWSLSYTRNKREMSNKDRDHGGQTQLPGGVTSSAAVGTV